MFCGKCGAENDKGAQFCKACGASLITNNSGVESKNAIGNETQSAGIGGGVDLSGVSEKIKAIPRKFLLIGLGVVVAIIAIICIVSNAKSTINLNDFYSIETEGYDGYGRASASINWDAVEKQYGDKIAIKSSALKEFGGFSQGMSAIDILREGIEFSLDKKDGLSNGDTLSYSWDVDEKLSDYVKCKLKYEDGSYTVSGLEKITKFDPFEGFDLEFTGIAPNGRVEVKNYPSDNGLKYSIDKDKGLSNGDKVTIKASLGRSSEEDYAREYGKLPSATSKEYTVEGLDEYVSSYAGIPGDVIEKLKKETQDVILAYVASSYDNTCSLGDLEYAGYIYCATKPGVDYWNEFNTLYLIYKGTVSNTEGKFPTTDIYFPVGYKNFLSNSEGVHYDADNRGINGSTYFADFWYSTRGYANPLIAYMELAETNRDNYTIECGDGFESYAEYSDVTSLDQIDASYREKLQAEAKETIESYIAKNYNEKSHVDNLSLKGEYLLVAKNPGKDFSKNNTYVIVYEGYVYNDDGKFEPLNVEYPVAYNGIVSLPDNEWMFTSSDGLVGHSDFPDNSWYSTKGYVDGSKMFSDIITSNRDNYTYEVSDGLKEFGE